MPRVAHEVHAADRVELPKMLLQCAERRSNDEGPRRSAPDIPRRKIATGCQSARPRRRSVRSKSTRRQRRLSLLEHQFSPAHQVRNTGVNFTDRPRGSSTSSAGVLIYSSPRAMGCLWRLALDHHQGRGGRGSHRDRRHGSGITAAHMARFTIRSSRRRTSQGDRPRTLVHVTESSRSTRQHHLRQQPGAWHSLHADAAARNRARRG